MINPQLQTNPFLTKSDFKEAFNELTKPLQTHLKNDRPGHLDLGTSGSVYDKDRQEVEAFMRPIWGLGPLLTSSDSSLLADYLKGIVEGTTPDSPNYWGEILDFDQLIVEMASLSTMILLNPEKVWQRFSKTEQQNIHDWLIKVNDHTIPRNNWHFFRVLVNLAMKKCQLPYSPQQMEEDLAILDSFYVGKGWYYDGVETQADYYISFAFHYYSLVYCHFMEEEDSKRVVVMKERAAKFAQSFKYWFDATGRALPFGRSLAYRFAQCSFWSALVFANVEALPWGELKGLISRNMHQWFDQDILNQSGVLSVGYAYENLVFAEGYNAPGSPYWACKSFLLLAVPDNHPFWEAEALPLKIVDKTLAAPESRNYYQYNESLTDLQAFPAGQFVNFQSHASAKYSKFVYSTNFGFSTPKSNYWYYEGAFDNCLALAEDEHYFRTKGLDDEYQILQDRIIHRWSPWEDVQLTSTIIPLENCHVRIHEMVTKRKLTAYEGSFSVPFDSTQKIARDTASCRSAIGTSTITNIIGFNEADVVRCEPNTNVLFQLTKLPYLKTTLVPGKHRLISLVSGVVPKETLLTPTIQLEGDNLIISQKDKNMRLHLS
jgi:hypothetical protein